MKADSCDQGGAPRSLGELRIWLVGGKRLTASFSQLCDVELLQPGSWGSASGGRRPAFLLIEAGEGTGAEWDGELDRLLESCERAAIPRLLWIASSSLSPALLERCRHFDRVFTMDSAQLPRLIGAGAPAPATLWPAAALPIASPRRAETAASKATVAWLGGWHTRWPAAWRERLGSILRGAANRGLRIVPGNESEGLPRSEAPEQVLRSARVIICADRASGSPTFAPAVLFDAIACGAAVITPHDFDTIHDFGTGGIRGPSSRDLVPAVHDGDSAAAAIGELLADEALREEVVSHLQRVVAHNHMPEHRLATLASAAGYRLTPNGLRPAPA